MKTDNKIPTEFKDLPEYIQDILWSDDTGIINEEIFKKFNLSAQQKDIFFDVLRKIVFKQINLRQLLEVLKPLGLREEQTKKIAVEILKRRVLPLSDYLKVNTLLYIKKWGGEIPADEFSKLVKTESQGKIDADNIIEQIIKETGLELKDHVLENRFKNIVLSFIRNVRSFTETAIVLKRPSKIGGMGIEQGLVDKIMTILQKEEQQSKTVSLSTKKIVSKEIAKALMRTPAKELLKIETKVLKVAPKLETSLVELKTKTQKPLIKKIEKIEKDKKIDTDSEEMTQDIEKAIKKFQPQKASPPQKKIILEEKKKQISKTPEKLAEIKPKFSDDIPVLKRNIPKPDKIMVESVSNYPKIYGPSDELRNISLIDWRRWGTSREAMLKILEKINLLGEESLIKKAEGIKSWKESEINKLYLGIGEESINKGKSVGKIISERQRDGRKTLTQKEFNAVVELNQKLRF